MSKHKKFKGGKLSARDLRNEILRLFKRSPRKRLNPKQVSKKLKSANNRDSVQAALDVLVEKGYLRSLGDYKYMLDRSVQVSSGRSRGDSEVVEGKMDMTRSGAGYVLVDGMANDVYISQRLMNGALNGDTVKIRTWTARGRRRPEGEVLEVTQRANDHFVGELVMKNGNGVVHPDGQVPITIYINSNDLADARAGEIVVAEVTKWPKPGSSRMPTGRITAVLGAPGSSNIDMQAILVNNGFNLAFPPRVLEETRDIPTEIPLAEINRRRDMRDVTTLTIDPVDAKDFDDALSVRRLEDGRYEIGVHIADVSHYVLPNTALDREAYKRSTSVYLVDRVLPMLPERISNELCSLRPNEDKLTFSAVFIMDKSGKVGERWFGRTVTHSDRRFTYEQAQEVIESGKGDYAEEILLLNKLAKKLRKDRFKKGSIDFDTQEVRFRLDEDGVPIEVYVKERKEAHMLIEDFMLLANREVASYIAQKGKDQAVPFVYRVHDLPDPERTAELARFAAEMGFRMDVSDPQKIAKSYNALIAAAETDPGLKLLAPLAIRTMAKAVYTTDNIGHYGLGFSYYTHFTSPIRRYSDVLVHRILFKNLGKGVTYRTNKVQLEEKCQHISMMERRAAEAERESIRYKQVEFLEKHIGDEFDGVVSGIIDRGFFVELIANGCEGFVPFDTLDEPYEVGSGRLTMTGLRTKTVRKMGDQVRVQIVSTDIAQRRVEMELV